MLADVVGIFPPYSKHSAKACGVSDEDVDDIFQHRNTLFGHVLHFVWFSKIVDNEAVLNQLVKVCVIVRRHEDFVHNNRIRLSAISVFNSCLLSLL